MIVPAIVAGILLRVWMLLGPRSFWADEWFSILLVRGSVREVFWGAVHDVHPPAYFLLLKGAVSLFGEAEWAFRLVSFLASIGTLLVLFLLAKLMLRDKAPWIAVLLAGASPYWLQSANEVRSYSLLAFLIGLSTYFFIRAAAADDGAGGRVRFAALFFLGTAASVYTEHYAWFWVFAIWVSAAWLARRGRLPKPLFISLIAAFVVCLPSLGLIGYQAVFKEQMFVAGRMKEYASFGVLAKKIGGIFFHMACGYRYSMLTAERVLSLARSSAGFWLSFAWTLLSLGLVLKGIASLFSRHRPYALLCVTGLFFPVLFLGIFYSIRLDARYLSFAAPFFFLLLAEGAASLGRPALRNLVLALGLGMLLGGSAHALSLSTDAIHKEDYRGLVRYVVAQAGEEDVICGLGPQFDYYRKEAGALRAAYLPGFDELLRSDVSRFRRIWYIDGMNMHPELFEDMHRRACAPLLPFGFVPEGKPVRFGGEEGLTALMVFVRGPERPMKGER